MIELLDQGLTVLTLLDLIQWRLSASCDGQVQLIGLGCPMSLAFRDFGVSF